MSDYAIVTDTGQQVGRYVKDPITGMVTAVVQMPLEGQWSWIYCGGFCDVNFDGYVNGRDFDNFLTWYAAGDVRADFNGDGYVNGVDYDEFVQQFIG